MNSAVFLTIVAVLSGISYTIWLRKRSSAILQRWADENDFEID